MWIGNYDIENTLATKTIRQAFMPNKASIFPSITNKLNEYYKRFQPFRNYIFKTYNFKSFLIKKIQIIIFFILFTRTRANIYLILLILAIFQFWFQGNPGKSTDNRSYKSSHLSKFNSAFFQRSLLQWNRASVYIFLLWKSIKHIYYSQVIE